MRFHRTTCYAAANVFLMISTALGSAQEPPLASGLQSPRGLFARTDGLLLVAEQGGRVLSLTPDGALTPVVAGIVTGTWEAPEGPSIVGASAAIQLGARSTT
jgi:hypothetical protein